jgi:hypothetical protein
MYVVVLSLLAGAPVLNPDTGVEELNAQRAAVRDRAMHRAEQRLVHFQLPANEQPSYQLLGFGECATEGLGLFDQWKGNNVKASACASMCSELPACLGYEIQAQRLECTVLVSVYGARFWW